MNVKQFNDVQRVLTNLNYSLHNETSSFDHSHRGMLKNMIKHAKFVAYLLQSKIIFMMNKGTEEQYIPSKEMANSKLNYFSFPY